MALDIESLRSRHFKTYEHNFSSRDLILYALGIGYGTKKEEELRYIFEHHSAFQAVATYGIIAAHPAIGNIPLEEYLPGFKRAKALHGEQYLRIFAPIPTHGKLLTQPYLVDVRDKGKGKGAVVVMKTVTRDATLGHIIAENEFVAYGLGAGGFGSDWAPAARPAAATADNTPPSRPPDRSITITTTADQAALYRLSGDYNPLHIDPDRAKKVGFSAPILHGLCTMGMSVKAVVDEFMGGDFGRLRSAKVRFSKHVFPDDTLRVNMWACPGNATRPVSNAASGLDVNAPLHKVIIETEVVGREGGGRAITNAAVEYADVPLTASLAASSKAAAVVPVYSSRL